MADIFRINIGVRVLCVFKESPWYSRKGTVTAFEYDGWIKVRWDDDYAVGLCHPNDLEIVRVVDYDQYAKLRQEADDLHKENRRLTKLIEDGGKQ